MTKHKKLELFSAQKLEITLSRLCYELIEQYSGFENTVMLAIQPRGIFLGRRIHNLLKKMRPAWHLPYGELDVTFHRDDFRRQQSPMLPNATQVDFIIENKNVILVDDVLYTGRTVRAALDAMLAFGRPAKVELLVLVDRRRKRELPVEPQYVGVEVDTLDAERVIVRLAKDDNEKDTIRIEPDTVEYKTKTES